MKLHSSECIYISNFIEQFHSQWEKQSQKGMRGGQVRCTARRLSGGDAEAFRGGGVGGPSGGRGAAGGCRASRERRDGGRRETDGAPDVGRDEMQGMASRRGVAVPAEGPHRRRRDAGHDGASWDGNGCRWKRSVAERNKENLCLPVRRRVKSSRGNRGEAACEAWGGDRRQTAQAACSEEDSGRRQFSFFL